MIDHGNFELVFSPMDRVGIGPFARQEQSAETGQVPAFEQFGVRVFALDRPEGGGGGEQN